MATASDRRDSQSDESFVSTAAKLIQTELDYGDVRYVRQVHGGIINKAAIYDTNRGQIFVKYAQRENARGMFDSEMESLKAIRATSAVRVPEPVKVLTHPDGGAIFVMECLDGLREMDRHWRDLGRKVARLHSHNPSLLQQERRQSQSVHRHDQENSVEPVRKFGFHVPSYMGSHHQMPAVWCDTWQEYWIRHTLEPQFDKAQQSGDRELGELWSELQLHIDKVFRGVEIQPSLLHGDFCSINVGELEQEAVIFDPTSFYGHSENDFTILHMEENFPESFYTEYHKVLPRQEHSYTLRKQAYLVSAYTLCFNGKYEPEHMHELALETGKALLHSLCEK